MASIKCGNHNSTFAVYHNSVEVVKACYAETHNAVKNVTTSTPLAVSTSSAPASRGYWSTGRNTQLRVDSRAHLAAEYYANLNNGKTNTNLSAESKKASVSIPKKKCSKCEEVKPLDGFHNRKASVDGKQSRCKECYKA